MNRTLKALRRFSIATILAGVAFSWNGQLTLDPASSMMSSAEARIGRPLTPLSYAGVARRTTRRTVAAGAVAAGAYAAPVVVAPACAQTVDVYGRVVTVCR